ncbi:hypothetical protein BC939DRAFT_492034 [Gamsiella multidivaricata]|uniref:uncharacterized protein n=1 Tax=Gamsiella multidivaricata TaxID=101098 RepID=UPI00221F3262|nr:uncharacterized protein BC939DRAFT_492034 [Gamsiella multidivaricata]KAI7825635.1 hypothetical protein BC939DRAFT_492034 [Gamsiella multidivaricata]
MASYSEADQVAQQQQHQNVDAISITTRPDSQDTISHLHQPSTFSPLEPTLKQEDTTSHLRNGSHLIADTSADHEDNEDSEADGDGDGDGDADEDEHSDGSNEDRDDRHDHNVRTNGGENKRDPIEEDGELSLSSDNDDDEEAASGHPNDEEYSNLPEETVCRWKDCGKVLPSLATLVIHLSDEHIGWKKTAYTCEWQGCSRRPIAQTTRFALISHMRSHTKHKPYDCPVPECDKSFSRSDAMAKHLKCQHGDVPERFTGRKSRGRYTMKDPAASSTLLPSSSFGAKKRRHHGSDAEQSASTSRMNPAKVRKLNDGRLEGDHRHYHPKFADSLILHHLDQSRKGGRRHHKDHSHHHDRDRDRDGQNSEGEGQEGEDEDAEDSDFADENGQTPRQRYGVLKAKFRYIHNERDSLEAEYEDLKKKLTRLRTERELLLDALLTSDQQYQDPALDAIDDSE